MNKNMDCRIIQDLLPSYVDGLTSDYTNQVIEEHMKQCEPCKEMLERMQEPEKHIDSIEKEVDYMKKVRSRMSRLLITALIAVAFLIIGAIAGLLIYNRVTPKSYQDIFANSKVESIEMTHLSSGTQYEFADWEVYEFQKMLEKANYYYEGKAGNVIEGDMLLMFVNNSNGSAYELKITEEYKLYYNGNVYDFRECKDLWDYLESKLQLEQKWLDWEKEKYEYLSGVYVIESDVPRESAISLELNMDTKYFSLLPHMFSSYRESGYFTIDDLTITLELESGPDYVFTIMEEGVLSYDAERSGPLYMVREETPIPDGSKFIKE